MLIVFLSTFQPNICYQILSFVDRNSEYILTKHLLTSILTLGEISKFKKYIFKRWIWSDCVETFKKDSAQSLWKNTQSPNNRLLKVYILWNFAMSASGKMGVNKCLSELSYVNYSCYLNLATIWISRLLYNSNSKHFLAINKKPYYQQFLLLFLDTWGQCYQHLWT
jgi:hypothetical protein